MKNIFKENKDLKEENNKLKMKIKELENELLRTEPYYKEIMNRKWVYLERKYENKIKSEKELIKIFKNLENRLNKEITGLPDYDLVADFDVYLKLLDYLKKKGE